jgi:hypothetical protein
VDPNLNGDVRPPQRDYLFSLLEVLLRQLLLFICHHVE